MNHSTHVRRWDRVIPLLREFESYLSPKTPTLKIENANDIQWSQDEYLRRRRENKLTRGNGVYLIFDDTDELRYVGMAMNTFDDRIWSHDESVNRRWTDIISFDPGWYFLAPALEFFLISRLQPPDNFTYISYRIPERLGEDTPQESMARIEG